MAWDRQGKHRLRLIDLGDQVERAVHKVWPLRYETGKAVAGQVKEKVPDTAFLIGSSWFTGTIRWYSTTTCLRLFFCVPPAGRFFFSFYYYYKTVSEVFPVIASDQYAEKETTPNTLHLRPSPSIISKRQHRPRHAVTSVPAADVHLHGKLAAMSYLFISM